MEIQQLFHIQKQLDETICNNHNLHNKDLIPAKILALEVELGELANETRCFKFWSKKMASPKDVILEEYVDCLHFLLSIGLDEDFHEAKFYIKENPRDLIQQFQDVFRKCSNFHQSLSEEAYVDLFEGFLSLGGKLGFTWQEVEEAYLKKNQVNYQRQEEGY
ncbi:Dimeric dUTPase, all-alpha-NTP-PPase (MazG) superfamily [Natronincola peptidivorans]|uniref:Dimeric dUTPase, all-alpha-NTP-PPase (MazG) superfamily n=1 Tax=Natronincola peptidivorans TaxID=426128 RepID=A0A1I0ANP0_9FIRM|nr:dUTP diphosphatase [Natronincola peptidivorans]SES95794.1 Dimeric dUTPase, all-alpha-NTP-PPase (MazG) superfamily [Natronincola peptidivorans]